MNGWRSVLGDHRAAEAVVQTDEAHIDVLADIVSESHSVDARREEDDVMVAKENMVVFDADRPVRGKADFQTGADRAAPPGLVIGRSDQRTSADEGRPDKDVRPASNHGAAALDVE